VSSPPFSENALFLFARQPEPGKVKTRLQTYFTPEQASRIHAACLRTVWMRAKTLTDRLDLIRVFTPDDLPDPAGSLLGSEGETMQVNLPVGHMPRCLAWAQGAGDLGTRLRRAFERGFDEGYRRVMAIGSDSPPLPLKYINEAIAVLDEVPLCIGPTEDGGYNLNGMRRKVYDVFRDIDWGTERVADQTRRRAEKAGLRVRDLPVWYDLDRPGDVDRVMADLMIEWGRPGEPELHRVLREALQEQECTRGDEP
jgi:hypothetical protein